MNNSRPRSCAAPSTCQWPDCGCCSQTTWAPIETHPKDRYILLCDANCPAWDGNKEVGIWGGDCFWSCGGANGGSEITVGGDQPYVTVFGHLDVFTHWMDLPDDPERECPDRSQA